MKLQVTKKHLLASEAINPSVKTWAIKNWDYLTEVNTPLINVNSSTKIAKGKKLKINTAILYMQPADKVAVKTLCAGADLFGCKKDCLVSSGQLGKTPAQKAVTKRTLCYLLERSRFFDVLRGEVYLHSANYGDTLAVRLNGTTDIDFNSFIASMPSIRFYDYTKVYFRVKSNKLNNYDLTFSGSANNAKTMAMTARAIKNGFKTVLAVNTAETKGEYKMPDKLDLIPLINMDDTDARFLDPAGSVGVLKRKGSNKLERAKDESKNGFFFNQSNIIKLTELVTA
jgi:hypothetical protein